jgi:hypothetical protein
LDDFKPLKKLCFLLSLFLKSLPLEGEIKRGRERDKDRFRKERLMIKSKQVKYQIMLKVYGAGIKRKNDKNAKYFRLVRNQQCFDIFKKCQSFGNIYNA